MSAMPSSETPAQRVRRIKREKSPLALLPDIERYARKGFGAISKEDLDVRLKAWGLWQQGDGKGGLAPAFGMRIRVPGGHLWAHQARAVADLSERYARSTLDLSDRQNFQLHHVQIEDVPAILQQLWRVGLSSQMSAGDFVRNVTTCPVAGLDADELYDTLPLVRELDRLIGGNPAFADLPRKLKVTITGCSSWCTYPEINDIGLTAVERRPGRGEIGFSLRVGGGLSTRPHLARRLNAFVLPHQVPAVVQGIARVFRDANVLRESRAKARLKFLFLEDGWDEERFLAELESRIGFRLDRAAPEVPPRDSHRDHVGIHRQKQPAFYFAGFDVPVGRLAPGQLRSLATLAELYGDGSLRTAVQQNIIIPNIAADRLSGFHSAAGIAGLPLEPAPISRGLLACSGSRYCSTALTETKAFGANLVAELDRRLPGFAGQVRIHVNGCPNSCGLHLIADIGLQGVKVKVGEESAEGYEFFIGGGVAGRAEIARRIPYRAPAPEVADALERLFRAFAAGRQEGEVFQDFARRRSSEELRDLLAGAGTVMN